MANIFRLIESDSHATFCDLGCGSGEFALEVAQRIGTKRVYGVDIVPSHVELARKRGISAVLGDLNKHLPLQNDFFDVVCSNQVIEHLSKPDNLVVEVSRILKPGGYVIISTENLSSWHNIAALVLGWTPFSMSHLAWDRVGVGNPMSLHRGSPSHGEESWRHVVVLAYRGLIELLALHSLKVEKVLGAGYYPFPALFGRLDPRHAAFLTIKARKSEL